jgi:hypothetical protein
MKIDGETGVPPVELGKARQVLIRDDWQIKT